MAWILALKSSPDCRDPSVWVSIVFGDRDFCGKIYRGALRSSSYLVGVMPDTNVARKIDDGGDSISMAAVIA